jgi:hypothetical protein
MRTPPSNGGVATATWHSSRQDRTAPPPAIQTPTEVLKIAPTTAGTVKAFVYIRVGAVTIKGAKIMQQPGQAAWLAMPDRSYVVSGKAECAPIIELDKSLRERATEVVLTAWKSGQ